MYLSPRKLKWLLNFYPPYLGAGIKVDTIDPNWRSMQVRMKLRWYNRNAVGSHFGGSLYSMVDPHLMLMLMQLLGRDYIVWDKSAHIEYISAVKTEVTADIQITDAQLGEIKKATENGEKFLPKYQVLITDTSGELVARVEKELYIRKKAPLERKG